jgi:putative transposase
MDILSLDGQTEDFWSDWGDGRPVRSTFIPLVDVASGMVLHRVLARSENAADTVRLIVETCERFSIPSQIHTDNGSAFAGYLVAGGNVHRFRSSGKKTYGMQPLGVCHHLGIRLRFALPANGQAKRAERTFADLSRCIDDRPEFKNAHTGHGPGAAPDTSIVSVPVDYARQIIAREVDRYNRESARRGDVTRGRSYEQTFRDLHADRVATKATERQIYLASLIYTPVAVDRHGRVKIVGWTYGGTDTQDALLRYHGNSQRILLGRTPRNLSDPALAWNEDGDLICEGIEAVERTACDSAEGPRIPGIVTERDCARPSKLSLFPKRSPASGCHPIEPVRDAAGRRLDLHAERTDPGPAPEPWATGEVCCDVVPTLRVRPADRCQP